MRDVNYTHRKNLDHMKLLLSDHDFVALREKIREELKIPAAGFQSVEEHGQWYSRCMVHDSDIRRTLREKKEVTMDDCRNAESKMFENRIDAAIKSILKIFNLPEHFYFHIKNHLLFGTVTAPETNCAVTLSFTPMGRPARNAGIARYASTTLDDEKKAKNLMDFLIEKAPAQFGFLKIGKGQRPKRQLDRDLKIIKARGSDEKIVTEIWDDTETFDFEKDIRRQHIVKKQKYRLKKTTKRMFGK